MFVSNLCRHACISCKISPENLCNSFQKYTYRYMKMLHCQALRYTCNIIITYLLYIPLKIIVNFYHKATGTEFAICSVFTTHFSTSACSCRCGLVPSFSRIGLTYIFVLQSIFFSRSTSLSYPVQNKIFKDHIWEYIKVMKN